MLPRNINPNKIPRLWNDSEYLEKNKDVARAVSSRALPSGWWHFVMRGIKEGRKATWLSSDAKKFDANPETAKVNYVVACWSGPRRGGNEQYHETRDYYLRTQVKALNAFKHHLAQVTFVINDYQDEPKSFTDFVDSLPSNIQTTKVEILRRENVGQSYGCYSYAYSQYRNEFDYYIFIEDDYIFVQDHFDNILIKNFQIYQCGYLCSLVFDWGVQPHAAISNGISSSQVLEEIYQYYSCLPHSNQHAIRKNPYSVDPQLSFSRAFLDSGYTLGNLAATYRAPFNNDGELKLYGNLDSEDLIVPVQFLDRLQIVL